MNRVYKLYWVNRLWNIVLFEGVIELLLYDKISALIWKCFVLRQELSEETVEPSDEMIEYDPSEQLDEQLADCSLLPESRWRNLS